MAISGQNVQNRHLLAKKGVLEAKSPRIGGSGQIWSKVPRIGAKVPRIGGSGRSGEGLAGSGSGLDLGLDLGEGYGRLDDLRGFRWPKNLQKHEKHENDENGCFGTLKNRPL